MTLETFSQSLLQRVLQLLAQRRLAFDGIRCDACFTAAVEAEYLAAAGTFEMAVLVLGR